MRLVILYYEILSVSALKLSSDGSLLYFAPSLYKCTEGTSSEKYLYYDSKCLKSIEL